MGQTGVQSKTEKEDLGNKTASGALKKTLICSWDVECFLNVQANVLILEKALVAYV